MTQDTSIIETSKWSRIFPYIAVGVFFLPYISGGVRPDNMLLLLLIILSPFLVFLKIEKELLGMLLLAVAPFFLICARLFFENYLHPFGWSAKIINQYSMFFSSILYFIFIRRFCSQNAFFRAFAIIAAIVCVYGLIQLLFPHSLLVTHLIPLYAGQPEQIRELSKVEQALRNLRASSIFVQPSTFGAFALLANAVAVWGMKNTSAKRFKYLMVFSVIGGIASVTKTYLLGAMLFFLYLYGKNIFTIKRLLHACALFFFIFFGIDIVSKGYFSAILEKMVRLGVFQALFGTRFGAGGTITSGMHQITSLNGLLVGGGSETRFLFYADSMPYMLLLLSGFAFLVVFYLPILFLLFLTIRSKVTAYLKRPFVGLNLVYLFLSLAFPIYIQARLFPLFVILCLYFLFESKALYPEQ